MWWIYLACFGLAAIFCLPLTMVVRHSGQKLKVYDVPNSRHINERTVPRLGGVPIVAASLIAVGIIFWACNIFKLTQLPDTDQSLLLSLIGGAVGVWLLGLFDDIRYVRARYKLLVQLAIALGAYLLGLQIHAIHFPVWGTLQLGDYALPFTILWIVGVMNSINLIDGIDGLCSGVVLGTLLGIFSLSIFFGSYVVALICCALIGSTFVFFMFFNFPPATIFLGDSGAYFLGFMVAALPIFIAAENTSPNVFHVSFLTFVIIPLVDTCLAIVRRMLMGVPVSTPDRGHLHHRLLDKGYSHKKITTLVSSISMVLVIVGVVIAFGNRWQTALALVLATVDVYLLLHLCDIDSLKDLRQPDETVSSKAGVLRKHLPSFFYELTGAADWTQVVKVLDGFSQNTAMHAAKIMYRENGHQDVIWSWNTQNSFSGRRARQLCKTYEMSDGNGGGYRCYFCWDSEYDHVHTDTDALLEVVSEIIGKSCNTVYLPVTTTIKTEYHQKQDAVC